MTKGPDLRSEMPDLRYWRPDLRPEWSDLGLEVIWTILGLERLVLMAFGPDLGSERPNLKLEGFEKADLGL